MDDKKKGSGLGKARRPMSMSERLGTMRAWQLVLMLVAVIGSAVLLVGAASGWFDGKKTVIDVEYRCGEECRDYALDLNSEEYEDLIGNEKSFVVLVDQGGCATADRLKEYMLEFARENGFQFHKIMFSDMKETSLHESVKYYPSVAIVSKGRVVGFLRADSDDDAIMYNDYEAFKNWLKRYF